jgi:hypothetical protein
MSMSSSLSLSGANYGLRRGESARDLEDFGDLGEGEGEWDVSPRYHPAPSRNEVSVVQPVLVSSTPPYSPGMSLKRSMLQVKQLEGDLPSVLQFLPKYMLTSTRTGNIKLWIRPLALRPKVKSSKSAPLPDLSDIS